MAEQYDYSDGTYQILQFWKGYLLWNYVGGYSNVINLQVYPDYANSSLVGSTGVLTHDDAYISAPRSYLPFTYIANRSITAKLWEDYMKRWYIYNKEMGDIEPTFSVVRTDNGKAWGSYEPVSGTTTEGRRMGRFIINANHDVASDGQTPVTIGLRFSILFQDKKSVSFIATQKTQGYSQSWNGFKFSFTFYSNASGGAYQEVNEVPYFTTDSTNLRVAISATSILTRTWDDGYPENLGSTAENIVSSGTYRPRLVCMQDSRVIYPSSFSEGIFEFTVPRVSGTSDITWRAIAYPEHDIASEGSATITFKANDIVTTYGFAFGEYTITQNALAIGSSSSKRISKAKIYIIRYTYQNGVLTGTESQYSSYTSEYEFTSQNLSTSAKSSASQSVSYTYSYGGQTYSLSKSGVVYKQEAATPGAVTYSYSRFDASQTSFGWAGGTSDISVIAYEATQWSDTAGNTYTDSVQTEYYTITASGDAYVTGNTVHIPKNPAGESERDFTVTLRVGGSSAGNATATKTFSQSAQSITGGGYEICLNLYASKTLGISHQGETITVRSVNPYYISYQSYQSGDRVYSSKVSIPMSYLSPVSTASGMTVSSPSTGEFNFHIPANSSSYEKDYRLVVQTSYPQNGSGQVRVWQNTASSSLSFRESWQEMGGYAWANNSTFGTARYSTNHGSHSSLSVTYLSWIGANSITLGVISDGEIGWDYLLVSKLDGESTALLSSVEDGDALHVFKTDNSYHEITLKDSLQTTSCHGVYLIYRKDGTTNKETDRAYAQVIGYVNPSGTYVALENRVEALRSSFVGDDSNHGVTITASTTSVQSSGGTVTLSASCLSGDRITYTIDSGSSYGTLSGSTFTFAQNSSSSQRAVIIAAECASGARATVTIVQAAGASQPSSHTITLSASVTTDVPASGTMTRQLTATHSGSDTISWSSSNTDVATVNSTGLVTFRANTGARRSVSITATCAGGGNSAPYTIYQAAYAAPQAGSIAIDLSRGEWRRSSVSLDGYNVYESDSNKGVNYGIAQTQLTLSGATSYTFWIHSYAESRYDYVIAFNPDDTTTVSKDSDGTDLINGLYHFTQTTVETFGENILAHTSTLDHGTSQVAPSSISVFKRVDVTVNSTGTHRILVIYGKDSGTNYGEDRGYIAIKE